MGLFGTINADLTRVKEIWLDPVCYAGVAALEGQFPDGIYAGFANDKLRALDNRNLRGEWVWIPRRPDGSRSYSDGADDILQRQALKNRTEGALSEAVEYSVGPLIHSQKIEVGTPGFEFRAKRAYKANMMVDEPISNLYGRPGVEAPIDQFLKYNEVLDQSFMTLEGDTPEAQGLHTPGITTLGQAQLSLEQGLARYQPFFDLKKKPIQDMAKNILLHIKEFKDWQFVIPLMGEDGQWDAKIFSGADLKTDFSVIAKIGTGKPITYGQKMAALEQAVRDGFVDLKGDTKARGYALDLLGIPVSSGLLDAERKSVWRDIAAIKDFYSTSQSAASNVAQMYGEQQPQGTAPQGMPPQGQAGAPQSYSGVPPQAIDAGQLGPIQSPQEAVLGSPPQGPPPGPQQIVNMPIHPRKFVDDHMAQVEFWKDYIKSDRFQKEDAPVQAASNQMLNEHISMFMEEQKQLNPPPPPQTRQNFQVRGSMPGDQAAALVEGISGAHSAQLDEATQQGRNELVDQSVQRQSDAQAAVVAAQAKQDLAQSTAMQGRSKEQRQNVETASRVAERAMNAEQPHPQAIAALKVAHGIAKDAATMNDVTPTEAGLVKAAADHEHKTAQLEANNVKTVLDHQHKMAQTAVDVAKTTLDHHHKMSQLEQQKEMAAMRDRVETPTPHKRGGGQNQE